MRVYFAAPLFSEAELKYNEWLANRIREEYPSIDIFVPQEHSAVNDQSQSVDSVAIAKYDTDALLTCDVLIAQLDGIHTDAGVASEVGVAYQAGIPVLGLFTDSRQHGADNQGKLEALKDVGESQFAYVNLYTVGLIKQQGHLYRTSDDLVAGIADYYTDKSDGLYEERLDLQ